MPFIGIIKPPKMEIMKPKTLSEIVTLRGMV